MTNRRKLLAILILCLAATPAYADCSNPAGKEADRFYNGDYHTYQFCNGTGWVAFGSAAGAGTTQLISTQTASNSASLPWTGLSGSNYLLICQNLIVGSTQGACIQFGQGSTPTWKTTNYNDAGTYALSNANGGTFGDNPMSGICWGYDSTTNPGISAALNLYSLSSSTVKKTVTGTAIYFQVTGGNLAVNASEGGWYDGDSNPATAVRVVSSSGNITSGSCSLYSVAN